MLPARTLCDDCPAYDAAQRRAPGSTPLECWRCVLERASSPELIRELAHVVLDEWRQARAWAWAEGIRVDNTSVDA
jgi:hypothetical protein